MAAFFETMPSNGETVASDPMARRKQPSCTKDLRKWSLEARQGRLQAVVSRFGCPVLLHPKRSKTVRR